MALEESRALTVHLHEPWHRNTRSLHTLSRTRPIPNSPLLTHAPRTYSCLDSPLGHALHRNQALWVNPKMHVIHVQCMWYMCGACDTCAVHVMRALNGSIPRLEPSPPDPSPGWNQALRIYPQAGTKPSGSIPRLEPSPPDQSPGWNQALWIHPQAGTKPSTNPSPGWNQALNESIPRLEPSPQRIHPQGAYVLVG